MKCISAKLCKRHQCFIFKCLAKLSFLPKILPHSGQEKLFLVWTSWMWRLKVSALLNFLLHFSHSKLSRFSKPSWKSVFNLIFICCSRMWRFKLAMDSYICPHSAQLQGSFLAGESLWTVVLCLDKEAMVENCLTHNPHLKNSTIFSSWCFLTW